MVKTIDADQVPVCGLNDRYSGGAINALTGTPWLVDGLISRWCRRITGAGSPHFIRKLSVIGKDEGEEMPCRLFRRFQAINRTTNASSVKNCNFVCLFFEWGIDAAYLALFR
ncbi:hypothetical protein [Bartonella choladocola]|uniref:hypothetical protein n=1 Tax=Bartonella choladocola TaxID=2750995 RepID=UPI003B520A55